MNDGFYPNPTDDTTPDSLQQTEAFSDSNRQTEVLSDSNQQTEVISDAYQTEVVSDAYSQTEVISDSTGERSNNQYQQCYSQNNSQLNRAPAYQPPVPQPPAYQPPVPQPPVYQPPVPQPPVYQPPVPQPPIYRAPDSLAPVYQAPVPVQVPVQVQVPVAVPVAVPYTPVPPKPPTPGKGMGIASMVMGIAAYVLSPCFFALGGILIVPVIFIGLILGIVGLAQSKKASQSNGMAIAGIVLNAIAVALFVSLLLIGFFALDHALDIYGFESIEDLFDLTINCI